MDATHEAKGTPRWRLLQKCHGKRDVSAMGLYRSQPYIAIAKGKYTTCNMNGTSEQSLVPRPCRLGTRLPRAELAAMAELYM